MAGRGLPWDVSLYVPLVVLMLIKAFDSRQMEAYVAENVVARVFIGRHHDAQAQIRDHSNIARAYAALGKAGIDEVNHLVIKEAHRFGFVDEGVLSADTTAQELPIGYPNEPGILRGLAQRCGRALTQLAQAGDWGTRQGAGAGANDLALGQRTPSLYLGQGGQAPGVDADIDARWAS